MSVNGRIELSRRRFHAARDGGDCPADRLIDRAEASVSVGARQLCCRLGGNARSFARGREDLHQAAQITLGEELFRQIVESEGKAVLKASETEQLELDWSASDCKTTTPDGRETTRLYVSADGVLVPTITQAEKDLRRGKVKEKRAKVPPARRRRLKPLAALKTGTDQRYKQIYGVCLYDQTQEHRLVGVTRQGTKGLKHLLKREAARTHLRAAAERIAIVDGAVCLRNNLEELPLEAILLDLYHLGEHVGEAGVKTGQAPPAEQTRKGAEAEKTTQDEAEKNDQAKGWAGEMLHTLRHEGYDPFFQKLVDWRSGLRGAKRKAADDLLKYVAPRAEMMLYRQADERGWDVGSGPMESMCGVTTDRIKGRGRRWDLDNAEAMMALETLYQSTGLWDKYWANALANQN